MAVLAPQTEAREDPEIGPIEAGRAFDEHAGVLEVPVGGPVEVLQGVVPEVEGLVVAA